MNILPQEWEMEGREQIKAILENLKDALVDVAKSYKCEEKECYLTFHPTGVMTIDVKGEPVFYFFNSQDLVNWLMARDNE